MQQHLEHLCVSGTSADGPHPASSSGSRASRAARVAQHWSWLRKYLARLLPRQGKGKGKGKGPSEEGALSRCYQELWSLVASMNDALAVQLSPLHRVRRHVVKRLGYPATLGSEEAASAHERAAR